MKHKLPYKNIKCQKYTFSKGKLKIILTSDDTVLLPAITFDIGLSVEWSEKIDIICELVVNIVINYFKNFSEEVSYLAKYNKIPIVTAFQEELFYRNDDIMYQDDVFSINTLKPIKPPENPILYNEDFIKLTDSDLSNALMTFTGGWDSTLTKSILDELYPDNTNATVIFDETNNYEVYKPVTTFSIQTNIDIPGLIPGFKKPYGRYFMQFTLLPVILLLSAIISEKIGFSTILMGNEILWESQGKDGLYQRFYDQSTIFSAHISNLLYNIWYNIKVGSILWNLTMYGVARVISNTDCINRKLLSCITPVEKNKPCNKCNKCQRAAYMYSCLWADYKRLGLEVNESNLLTYSELLNDSTTAKEEFMHLNYLANKYSLFSLWEGQSNPKLNELRKDIPYTHILPDRVYEFLAENLRKGRV